MVAGLPSAKIDHMRNHPFDTGGFYHIFNRGVEKRNIFLEKADFDRFLKSMEEFNTLLPIGSLFENSYAKAKSIKQRTLGSRTTKLEKPLVKIVCYCLNPNHYHFILQQLVDNGISMFMHRLSGGFTRYFNIKYKRSGVLFQGKFKSVPIISNEKLLLTSVYVNLNDQIHNLKKGSSVSSWIEYASKMHNGICAKDIILKQFKNIAEYKNYCKESIPVIIERKKQLKELQNLFFE